MPAAWTATMLGWRSRAMVRASARKRRTMEACAASSGWTTLIATRRSSVVSVARKTTPMPPRPSSRSSRYCGSSARLQGGERVERRVAHRRDRSRETGQEYTEPADHHWMHSRRKTLRRAVFQDVSG